MRCKSCDRLLTDQDNNDLCYECNRVSLKTTIDNNYDGSETSINDDVDILEQLNADTQ